MCEWTRKNQAIALMKKTRFLFAWFLPPRQRNNFRELLTHIQPSMNKYGQIKFGNVM